MRAQFTGFLIAAVLTSGCASRYVGTDPIHYRSTIDVAASGSPNEAACAPFAKWLAQNVYGPDTITGQSFSGATLYFVEYGEWPRSRGQIVDLLAKRKVPHDRIVNAEKYEILEIDNGLLIRFTEPGRPAGSIELQKPEMKKNEA